MRETRVGMQERRSPPSKSESSSRACPRIADWCDNSHDYQLIMWKTSIRADTASSCMGRTETNSVATRPLPSAPVASGGKAGLAAEWAKRRATWPRGQRQQEQLGLRIGPRGLQSAARGLPFTGVPSTPVASGGICKLGGWKEECGDVAWQWKCRIAAETERARQKRTWMAAWLERECDELAAPVE